MNQDTIKKYNLDLYDMTEVVGKYDVPKFEMEVGGML